MKLRLLAVGKARAGWVQEAVEDYSKRLTHYARFQLQELRAASGGDARDPIRARRVEGERILSCLRPGERLFALDERGQAFDSVALSHQLARWQNDRRDLSFVIGGAQGLDEPVLRRAEHRLSLSPMTLPHLLARVVWLEQLYRAFTLLRNEPYHNP